MSMVLDEMPAHAQYLRERLRGGAIICRVPRKAKRRKDSIWVLKNIEKLLARLDFDVRFLDKKKLRDLFALPHAPTSTDLKKRRNALIKLLHADVVDRDLKERAAKVLPIINSTYDNLTGKAERRRREMQEEHAQQQR